MSWHRYLRSIHNLLKHCSKLWSYIFSIAYFVCGDCTRREPYWALRFYLWPFGSDLAYGIIIYKSHGSPQATRECTIKFYLMEHTLTRLFWTFGILPALVLLSYLSLFHYWPLVIVLRLLSRDQTTTKSRQMDQYKPRNTYRLPPLHWCILKYGLSCCIWLCRCFSSKNHPSICLVQFETAPFRLLSWQWLGLHSTFRHCFHFILCLSQHATGKMFNLLLLLTQFWSACSLRFN
jgi:hypothetical protein